MKKILVTVSILAVLIVAGFFYLRYRKSKDFEPMIKEKLSQLVKDGSNGLYVLVIGKIEVDILDSKVRVHNVQLLIDSARLKVLDAEGASPADVYKISLSELNIDGFNVGDLLNKKNIDLDVLNIKNPVVDMYHPVNKNKEISKDTATLYSRIATSLGHFYIKDLSVSNMDFIYHNIAQEEKVTSFRNVSMRFSDIEIDSMTQYDTTRFLYAKNAVINFTGYSIRTPDSLYFVNADTLTLHAEQQTLAIKGLSLTPRGNKQEFSKKLTFYKDRYDIKFEKANFKNVRWYDLFLGEGFSAKNAELENGKMDVFVNRNITPSTRSKVGNYPHQLLMKLNFPVDVDTLTVKNFKFTYEELNPKTQKTGTVIFDDINGVITNVTNRQEKIALNKILQVKAHGSLMGKAGIDAVFTFDLTKIKGGDFMVDADLAPMNGTALNPTTSVLGMFEINSLSIKRLKAHVNGDNYTGNGTVFFVYDDLKITALGTDDSGKLKHKKILSFMANTFLISKSNTEKQAKAHFERDTHRSFFFLIWKTILNGITNTVAP